MPWKISNSPCSDPSCPTCLEIKRRREERKALKNIFANSETKLPLEQTNKVKAAEAESTPPS